METGTATPPSSTPVLAEDKTAAILAYITLIGFIAAVVIHSSKKTRLGAFHLRQTLGFMLTGIVAAVAQVVLAFIPILGWLAVLAMWCGLLVCWVHGLMAAVNGQMKPMPIVGEFYQQTFKNTFE